MTRLSMSCPRFLLTLISVFIVATAVSAASESSDLAWPKIERENKPWTRWWWPGSAVDSENLTHELTSLSEVGFGGVEITPIYGAKGAEARFIPYLSDRYIEALRFTGSEAKRLGMGVDMATGTGWPFGGPQVTREDAEQKIDIKDGKLAPRPTGFRVKRSAPGGEGFVVDPFSTLALAHYLEPFTAALGKLPAGTIHGQFHDSFEYTANWANELPDRFASIHGYRLEDHTAELSGKGDLDTIARIKSDYRDTLSELHLDYVKAWVSWAHSLGEIAREQAHGAPGNLLDLYAAADIPETEIFGSSPYSIPGFRSEPSELSPNKPLPLINRFASSAAHVAGRPLASSETFTWLREHFHESPSEMKPELDRLFSAGINHIFYHGTAYSPADAPWPGWLFYASTQFNPRNSLWKEFAWLNAYIARSQSLLQSGSPDNELLVYWPFYDAIYGADKWQRQFTMHAREWLDDAPIGVAAQLLIKNGYGFDFISDAQIVATKTSNDELVTAGGNYRAVLVPATKYMPTETLEALLSDASAGATVIFLGDLPSDVPGYTSLEARRALLKAKLSQLHWTDGGKGLRVAKLGKGRVLNGPSAEALLAEAKLAREPLADQGVSLVRRRTADGTLYFLANLTGKALDGWFALARPAHSAILMDARTERTGLAAVRTQKGQAEVYLQLAPGESVFVKALSHRNAQGQKWPYVKTSGEAVPIQGEWNIQFTEGGPELPSPWKTKDLHSWTEAGGESERFGGTARYQLEFTLPESAKADDWQLDLGDVRETARVTVNGTEIDRLWSLPFHTRVGAQLKAGRNLLAVEVTNLSANRIRDMDQRHVAWKNFYEINFVNIQYEPFNGAHWPLQPSGLLGPVTLTPLKAITP